MLLVLTTPIGLHHVILGNQKIIKYHNNYVAIVDITHEVSAIASFMDLVTVALDDSTNLTATATSELGNNFYGKRSP